MKKLFLLGLCIILLISGCQIVKDCGDCRCDWKPLDDYIRNEGYEQCLKDYNLGDEAEDYEEYYDGCNYHRCYKGICTTTLLYCYEDK